jgi:hypothetical protein
MTIDPDVQRTAHVWGLPAELLQAVVQAEGNILKAVQCSLPHTQTREQALTILARSCVHAMADYLHETDPRGFVEFWAARWAPVGAENDPTGLNHNWVANVEKLWNV